MTYDFSENIQRGILYIVKSSKDSFLEVSNLVKPEFFEFPIHGNIYNIVSNYYEKYKKLPNDEIILQESKEIATSRIPFSEYEDEVSCINNLDTSSISNTDYIIDIVEKFAKKEAMKCAIAESVHLIKEDRFGEVEDKVKRALQVNRDVNLGLSYFNSLKDRWDRINNRKNEDKFKTILPKVDESLEGGLNRKELAMVVAPPGVGKSLYLVNQGVKAMTEGRKVLYISLEMSEDKIAQRFDSVMTLIPQSRLKDPATQLSLNERIKIFQTEFPESRLMIKEFPTGTASVNNIRSLLTQIQNYEEFVPDLLIVDYLELLRSVREIDAEYQAQQRIAEELRGLAMEYNLLVWTATQTNRQGAKVNVITDAELGDSYGKIRTCDFSMSLNQTTEEFDNGEMRGYIMKSRNGRARWMCPMSVDYSTLRIAQAN